MAIVQIKIVIIHNIYYINFISFNISTFFLISPAEIELRLILPYVLYAVKHLFSPFLLEKNSKFPSTKEKVTLLDVCTHSPTQIHLTQHK